MDDRYRRVLIALICAGLVLLVSPLMAGEIYKWIDENGRVQFSDKAPEQSGSVTPEKITVKPIGNSIESPDVSVSGFLQNAEARHEQARNEEAKRQNMVVMYSAVWCGVCKSARRYFVANDIPFSEYDIESSERGRNDYARLNGRGVPIILVGKQRMNGFDPARFRRMYPH